jgi:prolipoprotein diacylglyceryltransferase
MVTFLRYLEAGLGILMAAGIAASLGFLAESAGMATEGRLVLTGAVAGILGARLVSMAFDDEDDEEG